MAGALLFMGDGHARQGDGEEMQRLLVADYAVEYEIANVVDPSFTVVSKIRKSFLRR